MYRLEIQSSIRTIGDSGAFSEGGEWNYVLHTMSQLTKSLRGLADIVEDSNHGLKITYSCEVYPAPFGAPTLLPLLRNYGMRVRSAQNTLLIARGLSASRCSIP